MSAGASRVGVSTDGAFWADAVEMRNRPARKDRAADISGEAREVAVKRKHEIRG
jgi:hypothetical protein